jgi:hypothetical protein
VLSKPVIDAIGTGKDQSIEWLSPKADDEYSEYRDQAHVWQLPNWFDRREILNGKDCFKRRKA